MMAEIFCIQSIRFLCWLLLSSEVTSSSPALLMRFLLWAMKWKITTSYHGYTLKIKYQQTQRSVNDMCTKVRNCSSAIVIPAFTQMPQHRKTNLFKDFLSNIFWDPVCCLNVESDLCFRADCGLSCHYAGHVLHKIQGLVQAVNGHLSLWHMNYFLYNKVDLWQPLLTCWPPGPLLLL